MTSDSLKERILAEMTVSHADALEKHFELAKQLIQITTTGKIHLVEKDNYNAKEQIVLYLIGKVYAKKAELSIEDGADRSELMSELGLPGGTVDPKLKELADGRVIERNKDATATKYSVSLARLEQQLKAIQLKRGGKK